MYVYMYVTEIKDSWISYRVADIYCNQLQVVIICKPPRRQLTDLFQWQVILLFTSLQNHFDPLYSEKRLFVIEFKRDSVIALYLAWKPHVCIVRAIQHLNVNKSFVSRTIASYRCTGSVASHPESGQKKER